MNNIDSFNAKAAARAAAASKLVASFPYLVPVSAKNDSLVAAAKNVRIELRRAFPDVKFAVRSSRYSGGDSIDVSWVDGPTSNMVDAIISKYRAGDFNGMDDSYSYRSDSWNDAFGDANYVHSSRSYSDKVVGAVMGRVARLYGVNPAPALADYRSGSLYRVSAGGSDFGREVNYALSRHTCSINRSASKVAA